MCKERGASSAALVSFGQFAPKAADDEDAGSYREAGNGGAAKLLFETEREAFKAFGLCG